MTGIVYLVGAGPGDPRLLTLRGAEVLRQADVVVYDRLAPSALLDLAPRAAERIFAGKVPGGPTMDQETINRLLVAHALEGKTVVRLKGGDPFVFGRGGEEALACARADVPFEVVPGVTSAVAAPASVGVPLTFRGVSASVAIITASRATTGPADLRAAADADTVVVLMAAERLEETCRLLVRAGRLPEEPAAIVQWATTSRQRHVTGTLATVPSLAENAGIAAPATLVVGQVASLANELGSRETGGNAQEPLESEPQIPRLAGSG